MSEFFPDRPSLAEVVVSNEFGEIQHVYKSSTTPLYDPFSVEYVIPQRELINSALLVARPNIDKVYGDHADYVEDLLAVSCEYALQARLVKAHDERNEFFARTLFDGHDTAKSGDKLRHYSIIDHLVRVSTGRCPAEELDHIKEFKDLEKCAALIGALCGRIADINSPESALEFLINHPALRSAELANMTHPLRWDAPDSMATDVDTTIGKLLPDSQLYLDDSSMDIDIRRTHTVTRREHSVTSGGTYAIVRTKQIHSFDEASGIGVVRRSNYVINLCNSAKDIYGPDHQFVREEMLRATQEGTKFSDLPSAEGIAAVFQEVLHRDPLARPIWLEPGVTSYYAARKTSLIEETA